MGGETTESIELDLTTKNYTANTNVIPPPPNATYPDVNGNPWRFNFRYTPTEEGGALHHTCQEAYDQLADHKPCTSFRYGSLGCYANQRVLGGKVGAMQDVMARYP
jgi:hypothetical protein